jgi:OmpA family
MTHSNRLLVLRQYHRPQTIKDEISSIACMSPITGRTKKQNRLLSERRAETVVSYLKDHGVTHQMTARGFDEEHPIADNATLRVDDRTVRQRLRIGGL